MMIVTMDMVMMTWVGQSGSGHEMSYAPSITSNVMYCCMHCNKQLSIEVQVVSFYPYPSNTFHIVKITSLQKEQPHSSNLTMAEAGQS